MQTSSKLPPKRKFAGNPNDPDYRKLVGHGWDTYAAHQFNVLTWLGLKSRHRLLDIGCGGLRGGRLFIAFLEKEKYYGIEPAEWAIEEAIESEFGQEYIDMRMPSFDYNANANLSVFNKKFDFILAHSVLVHAPKEWIYVCFQQAKEVLEPNGKFVANIVLTNRDSGETGWDYPNIRHHSKKTIQSIAHNVGLNIAITKIKHPAKDGYTWIILTHADKK